MKFVLEPNVSGTEGRIRGFNVKALPYMAEVFRKTYTYEKVDGEFKRLPEQWVGEMQDFTNLDDAMTFVLNLWAAEGIMFIGPGDVAVCDFEGIHYEWTLGEDDRLTLQKGVMNAV